MIVILNDNEMSIAPNVGALHNVLGRLRTAGKYHWVKDELEYIKENPSSWRESGATAEKIKDSLKYLLVSGVRRVRLYIFSPVDGHDYEKLFETLQYAKKTKGPVLVHVITKKEKVINRLRVTLLELGMEQGLIKLNQVTSLSRKKLHQHGVLSLVKQYLS